MVNTSYLSVKIHYFRSNILLLTVLMSIFFQPLGLMGGTFKLQWFLVLALVIFFDLMFSKKIKYDEIIVVILIFAIYNIVLFLFAGTTPSHDLMVSFLHFGRAVALLLIYVWILNKFQVEQLNYVARMMLFILYAFALFCILDFYFLNQFYTLYGDRLEFLRFGTNSLSYFMVCSIAFVFFYESNSFRKILFTVLMINILLLTGSRAGILALIVLIVFSIFKIPVKKEADMIKKTTVIASVFVFVLLFGDNILNMEIMKRLGMFVERISSDSLFAIEEARVGAQFAFLSDPEWNVLTGYYFYYFYSLNQYTMHSIFAELLYDTGVVGLAIFIALLYGFYRNIKKGEGYTQIIAIIIVANLTENYFFQFMPLLILYLITNISAKRGNCTNV